jgi:hypothetical protein
MPSIGCALLAIVAATGGPPSSPCLLRLTEKILNRQLLQ